MKWAEQLSAGGAKMSALAPVRSRWPEDDPEAAAEFARERGSGEEDPILEGIAGQWTRKDPIAAFAWAQGLPPSMRETALPSVISTLAHLEPSAAAESAVHLSGETQVEAAGAVVSQWATTDSVAASQWAASFPEGKTREQVFQDLLNSTNGPKMIRAGLLPGLAPFRKVAHGMRRSALLRIASRRSTPRLHCNGP